jgi:hypothetical protein
VLSSRAFVVPIVVALVVALAVMGACGGASPAPSSVASSSSSISAASATPSGPFVAHDLDGPYASLAAYCKSAAQKEAWGPDRKCRLDETPVASAPSSDAAARVLRIDDVVAGGVKQIACRLAIVAPVGTFVDDAEDAGACEGMVGPESMVHTTFDELAWSKGILRLLTRETRDGTTTDRLVLCALSTAGVPRCTPRVVVACSDAQSPTHAHVLSWSLESSVLHLRSNETASDLSCDSGAELVVGDHVLW